MVLVLVIVACGSEAVKGDGDENIEDACSYETGPSLENVPQEEWPEGMSAAWAAYESIGPSGELSLACDDDSEDITFALSSVERVALSQFVFSDLAGPEGCSGHGPASGSMSVSIEADGVPIELAAEVWLNRDEGVPERVTASASDEDESWGFRFADDGTLAYASAHVRAARFCSWYQEGA